jgi:hypothetical protein
MNSKGVIRLMVALVVAAMLTGAYFIVADSHARSGLPSQPAPSGFMH